MAEVMKDQQAQAEATTEQPSDFFVAERAVVTLHRLAQHLRFALGAIKQDLGIFRQIRFFHICNFLRAFSARRNQATDFFIDCINFVS